MERWASLSADSLKQILRCPRCYQFPICTPVFMCRLGHHICGACYHDAKFPPGCEIPNEGNLESSSKSTGDCFCVQCGAELTTTRNIVAEQILQMMLKRSTTCLRSVHSDPVPPSVSRTHLPEWGDEERDSSVKELSSPQESSCEILNPLSTSPSQYSQNTESDAIVFTTHRPILCPKSPCNRSVGVTAITSHFSYEHPEVPMLCVDPGMISHLHVSPTAIPFNIGRCITLLLVSGKGRSPQRAPLQVPAQLTVARLKNHLPLPLMAARLKTNEELTVAKCDYIIMIWVASAEAADMSFCTLEATNVTYNTRSLRYCGPIGSLRDSQKPIDVYQRGDCLIINPGLMIQLSPEGGYDLNVIVH